MKRLSLIKIIFFLIIFIMACEKKDVVIDNISLKQRANIKSFKSEINNKALVGDFLIHWGSSNNKYITIYHMDDPSRPVWETKKGEPYVWARLVETEFNEHTGAFTVIENLASDINEEDKDIQIKKIKTNISLVNEEKQALLIELIHTIEDLKHNNKY